MTMSEQNEYTLKELFEEAKKDTSWEPDEQKREELAAELFGAVGRA
jgi:hypothetical protein